MVELMIRIQTDWNLKLEEYYLYPKSLKDSNLDRLEFKGNKLGIKESLKYIRIQTDWNLKVKPSLTNITAGIFEFRQIGI